MAGLIRAVVPKAAVDRSGARQIARHLPALGHIEAELPHRPELGMVQCVAIGVVAAVGKRAYIPVADSETSERPRVETEAGARNLHRTILDDLAERLVGRTDLRSEFEEEG